MTSPPFPAAASAAARDAAKTHLRIAPSDENPLIDGLAATALALCEAFNGGAIIARDWTAILPAAPTWQRLGTAPVYTIDAIEGLPAEGAAFALPTSAYAIDIDAEGEGWVRVIAPGAAGRVRVRFGAGGASGWDDLPPPLAQGVVLLIAHLFDAREGGAEPPAAIAALWRPWRRLRLARAAYA